MQAIRRIGAFALLLGAGACGGGKLDADTTAAKKATSASESQKLGADGAAPGAERPRFVIKASSWERPAEQVAKRAGRPQVVSWKEGQRQRFAREARERWKNTEIFVRKRKD